MKNKSTYHSTITFPKFNNTRCLMMPYIQGDSKSVPLEYRKGYESILNTLYLEKGKIGYLTIDESAVSKGKPHRGERALNDRAIHTEAGKHPDKVYAWGGGGWGSSHRVTLDEDVQILIANSIDKSCAVWNTTHKDTSIDGDIGHLAHLYPFNEAELTKPGEVHQIGILTPHESLPVKMDTNRQFIRIVGSGVHGREPYFTKNKLLPNVH